MSDNKTKIGDQGIKTSIIHTENEISSSSAPANPDLDKNLFAFDNKTKKDPDEKSLNSAQFTEDELKGSDGKNDGNKTAEKNKLSEKEKIKRIENQEKIENDRILLNQADKMITETERMEKQYQKEHSFLYLYSQDPQLKSLINKIKITLLKISFGCLIQLFYSLLDDLVFTKNEPVIMTFVILSIVSLFMCIFSIAIIQIGLLNDPYGSKGFRIMVVFEALVMVITYIFNLSSVLITFIRFGEERKSFVEKFLIILISISVLVLLIPLTFFCIKLGIDSGLILIGKKTEYSVLVAEEKMNKSKNDSNTGEIAITTSGNINSEKDKDKESEEEKQKRLDKEAIENMFETFHVGVSAERIDDVMKNVEEIVS